MPGLKNHFEPLYDQDRNLVGIWLSPELWLKAQAALSPVIDKALEALSPESVKEQPEPIKDWEALIQFWDFDYPLPTDVSCKQCGSHTEDWQKDEPRVFRLRSASLGGLVNFQCQKCKARIIKKHFKKHIDVDCRPFVEK
ncbi:hypothetical protein [Fundidesulfovibrio agrisoli]|uniref:hypothetical protein n=1 Tax=Fundidesulfovibrio agrisoli TaxID=2922717 RepID=UPI001FABEE29